MGQFIEVQGPAIITRLVLKINVQASIQINLHVPVFQGAESLGGPGTARLPVASRHGSKNSLDIIEPRPFAPIKFKDSLIPIQLPQIHGRGRLSAVEVGMVANFMELQSVDDVHAT